MEGSDLRGRILDEIENLIIASCPKKNVSLQHTNFHIALLKKHYNACEVSIDYHRRRIIMEILMNDADYDPDIVNLNLPILHVNLLFRDLSEFLKLCMDSDIKSLLFYKSLLYFHDNVG